VTTRSIVLRVFGGLVVLGLLALALHTGNWGRAIQAALQINPAVLVVALGFTVVSLLITGIIWGRVLWCLGHAAPVSVGVTVFAASGLASYLGAGFGAMAQCLVLLRRRGVCAGRTALLMTIATIICFSGSMLWAPCGALLLAAPAAVHALPMAGSDTRLLAMIAMAVTGSGSLLALWLLTLTPKLRGRWRLARFAVDPAAPLLRINFHQLLMLVPPAGLAWLLGSVPLWLLLRADAPHAAVSLPLAIAMQALADAIGSMAFFMPNGLGARDGVLVALLVGVAGVPLPIAASLAVLVRLADPAGKAVLLLGATATNRISARVRQSPEGHALALAS
jgi:uncharacterized membrane protein YbhN (UPF0104 family)